ncbi:uL15 family ribosomal protein [Candidatus Nomurabacteria bacterium]|nr:uL15 family ribosomal protein [Candidatus Nomurabacteria bacterium]
MLHSLSSTNTSKKRVGRGGKRGKTSGRGHKGQKQHGGHGIRPEMRDLIKKIPKLRGHGKNRARTVVHKPNTLAINLATLESLFDTGATITPDTLIEKGLVSAGAVNRNGIKLLGHGDLTKKFAIQGITASKTAAEKITKAGGSLS